MHNINTEGKLAGVASAFELNEVKCASGCGVGTIEKSLTQKHLVEFPDPVLRLAASTSA